MVLCVNEDKRFFDPRILSYMEEGKSAVVKKLLEDSGNFCDLVDSCGSTLLHYAAKFGNANVLQYLIDSGSDVNAQDNTGFTPLMLAIPADERNSIVKLLEAKARIDIKNQFGEDALSIVFRLLNLYKSNTCNRNLYKIVNRFLLQMKRDCSNNSQFMAKRLLEGDCQLRHAVCLKNTMVIDIMLKNRAIHPRELAAALYEAIDFEDLPNVKVLVENGAIEACSHKHPLVFYHIYTKETPQELEILEILMSRCNFETADSQVVTYYLLALCSRKVVSILLKYIDLRTEVMFEGPDEIDAWKSTYLLGLMGNPNPDIVNELPAGVNVDFHKLDSRGDSCLARAASVCNLSTVEFLLGKGVQVNDDNRFGYNVLMTVFNCESPQKIKLKVINILLKYDADIQFINEMSLTTLKTVFDFATRKNFALTKQVVAHLAMLESIGKPIAQLIYDKIETHPMFKSHLKLSKLRLERMKRITVHKSVTLYKLLTESDAKVMLYVQNREFPDRFNRLMRGRRRSNAYFDFILRRRTFECIHAVRMKREAAAVLTEILQIDNHTVTDRVLDYLSVDDWKSLQAVN